MKENTRIKLNASFYQLFFNISFSCLRADLLCLRPSKGWVVIMDGWIVHVFTPRLSINRATWSEEKKENIVPYESVYMFFCLRPYQFPKRTFTVRVPRDPPKEKRLQITDGWILLAVFLPEQRVTGCIEEQLVKLFKPLFIVPSSTRCISVSLCMWTSAPSCITTTTRLHQSVLPRRPAVLFISMNLSCRLKQHAGTNPSTDRPFPSSCFISTPGTSHRPPPSLSLWQPDLLCVSSSGFCVSTFIPPSLSSFIWSPEYSLFPPSPSGLNIWQTVSTPIQTTHCQAHKQQTAAALVISFKHTRKIQTEICRNPNRFSPN